MARTSAISTIRPRRAAPVFVCKKCLKRIDDGPALKRELKSELKRRSAAQGVKRPRVIMTGCMDICPKRAVVAASGTTLARGEYLLLADGDGTAEAAERLMRPERN
jgi:predicted metal-binding protein